MGMRRPHVKSRSGCIQCKRRKIKCDEEKPTCRHCTRYNEVCEYQTPPPRRKSSTLHRSQETTPAVAPAATHNDDETNATSSTSLRTTTRARSSVRLKPKRSISRQRAQSEHRGATPVPQLASAQSTPSRPLHLDPLAVPGTNQIKDISPATTDLELEDMRLLHYWMCTASHGLCYNHKTWSQYIPSLAWKHPFVLRGVLAVSALHLAREEPQFSAKHLEVARHHQDLALPAYRYMIQHIDKDNCNAVIAFAHVLAVIGVASPLDSDGTDYFDPSPSKFRSKGKPISPNAKGTWKITQDWFALLRGLGTLLNAHFDWISTGPLAELLVGCTFKSMPGELIVDHSWNPHDNQLERLRPIFRRFQWNSAGLEDEMDICESAWGLLRESFALTFAPPSALKVIPGLVKWDISFSCVHPDMAFFIWAERVPQAFFRLLTEFRPEALVLLAFSCALLKRAPHAWFLDGVAERTLGTVEELLSEEWKTWLEWPQSEILGR